MSTSLTVGFKVKNLDIRYKVQVKSSNFFIEDTVGYGYELVDDIGDKFVKKIDLNGNYGNFDITIVSIDNNGTKSNSVKGSVFVSPPDIGETFSFKDVSLINQKHDDDQFNKLVSQGENVLEKNISFGSRNLNISWSLMYPESHALSNQIVGDGVFTDPFFSGFRLDFNSQDVPLRSFANNIRGLDGKINFTGQSVEDVFSNYKSLSLNLTEKDFNFLGLSREFTMNVVSVDCFGNEATGIVNFSNDIPSIDFFDYSLNGSSSVFNWSSSDNDFEGANINVLTVPSGTPLPYPRDLQLNADHFQKIKEAKKYESIKGASYKMGDFVEYNNKIYRSEASHTRISGENPELVESEEFVSGGAWTMVGDVVDFNYFSNDVRKGFAYLDQDSSSISKGGQYENYSFKVNQAWGWDYYYSLQPYDQYGSGDLYNLTEAGLVGKQSFVSYNEDPLDIIEVDGDGSGLINEEKYKALRSPSKLKAIRCALEITDLRFSENKGDIVFNWNTKNQDNQEVDLNQYKFLFGDGDIPSILGISGSLYDVESRQTITGITEGFNSKSLDFNEDEQLIVNDRLPSAKIFNQYNFVRELNNKLFQFKGGYGDIYDYSYNQLYVSGDRVFVGDDVYECKDVNLKDINVDGVFVRPKYGLWGDLLDYTFSSGEYFVYDNDLYLTNEIFDQDMPNASGLFDWRNIYNSGDIVLFPEENIREYDNLSEYNPKDIVYYSGAFYECIEKVKLLDSLSPEYKDNWERLSSLQDFKNSLFISNLDNNSGVPNIDFDKWSKVNPKKLNEENKYCKIIVPGYEGGVQHWLSGVYFNSGSLALYDNDIWISQSLNINQAPSGESSYWSNTGSFGLYSDYYERNYLSGDLVFANNSVYKCTNDNPSGSPISAQFGVGESILSSYELTHWMPIWEKQEFSKKDVVVKNGLPQGGKRNIGLELGLVDKRGNIINYANIDAFNPPPKIINSGFHVDSVSEATKVKFNFNYDQGFQEKTTKVYLYRSSEPNFDIVDEFGFPLTGEGSPFVKSVLGAGDATFGQNITTLTDTPPIPQISGVDQITGYYYKILPFDDFGSGVLHSVPTGVSEKVIVYPKRYSSSNKNAVPGEILRSNPTGVDGPVPNQVENLSGFTSFEGFTLTWNAPGISGKNYEAEKISWSNNDIDYYEIWASTGEYIQTGLDAGSATNLSKSENVGFRKIDGEFYSLSQSGITPTESIDVANYILNADNVLNLPASTPSVEAIYPGKTNESKNFWVRSVDFAGNKSKFSEFSQDPAEVKGLSLSLSKASALDMKDFEVNMTEGFSRTISLLPGNPFSVNEATDEISWGQHYLYNQGTGYIVSGNSTNDSFIWWDKNDLSGNLNLHDYYVKTQDNIIEKYDSHDLSNLSEFDVVLGQPLRNVYFSGVDYKTSAVHPANNESLEDIESTQSGFDDDDFIVARNLSGSVEPVNVSFTKALIGTANIANAAIKTAHVNNLSADKISAGEIKSADIQVGTGVDGSAVLRSAGFSGINNQLDNTGFFLSGDGSFGFQAGDSSLSFEDDTLTLRGKLRQTNNFDYDFVDLNASTNIFNYIEAKGYENGSPWVDTFLPDDNSPSVIDITAVFRNSSVPETGIRFKMDATHGDSVHSVFGYEDYNTVDGSYSISGFNYDPSVDFEANGDTKIAIATFGLGERAVSDGFDDIIDRAFGGFGLADSILVSVSGINSTFEKSVSIGRINDGKVGERGLTPTYRGVWNNSASYVFIDSQDGQPGRGDIVEFSQNHPNRIDQGDSINSNYFISIQTASNQLPITGGQLNSFYWREFGAELESVATNLLLTKEAFVSEKLTLGVGESSSSSPGSGIIVSSDFIGGILDASSGAPVSVVQEDYTNPGFLLARTDNSVCFDIGGTGKQGNASYVRFDSLSGKIEIAGSVINNTVNDESLFLESGSFDPFVGADYDTTFIGGGYNNKFLKLDPFNTIGSSIVGGASNEVNGKLSTIAGGYSGYCADNFSFIGGGFANNMPLEEAGNHQGSNFIGCGIENTISGGSTQSILNGVENIISQSQEEVNNNSVYFDDDQGWLSFRVLGDNQSAVFVDQLNGFVSGVWFPASENQNWGEDQSGFWDNRLFVGELGGIRKSGWVWHHDLKWMLLSATGFSQYSEEEEKLIWAWSDVRQRWYLFGRTFVDQEREHIIVFSTDGWFFLRKNHTSGRVEIREYDFYSDDYSENSSWEAWLGD